MNRDQDFGRLLKLLALKRHEQPPPGYFDQLPRDIMVCLRTQRARRYSWGNDPTEEASWLRRLWFAFEAKPMLAGAFGVIVSGLVVFGIVYSELPSQEAATAATAANKPWTIGSPSPAALALQPASAAEPSTNPVINTQFPAGLFDGVGLNAQPVSLTPERK